MTEQARLNYDRPLFNLHKVSSTPVIVESIDVVRWRDIYFLRARSSDGAEGLVMISEGRHFLTAMLQERILPFFVGRDVRDLETLVDEIYVYKSNYKYAGSALWTTVAWAEAALFDLLGKTTGKPIAALLGGRRRNEVPVYVSSLVRETSAEEEVEWVGRRIEQTKAKAVKLKIGGRLSGNADASPGRSERLIALARRTWGSEMKIYVDANGSYDAPHEADQSSDDSHERREIDPVLCRESLIDACYDAGAIAHRQQIHRYRNGDVVDQRRDVATRNDVEITLPEKLGHEKGRHAHDRRHELAAER